MYSFLTESSVSYCWRYTKHLNKVCSPLKKHAFWYLLDLDVGAESLFNVAGTDVREKYRPIKTFLPKIELPDSPDTFYGTFYGTFYAFYGTFYALRYLLRPLFEPHLVCEDRRRILLRKIQCSVNSRLSKIRSLCITYVCCTPDGLFWLNLYFWVKARVMLM